MWFEQLFGFREGAYEATRARFVVEGSTLRSLANGRAFAIGQFATPTLASLRARARALPAARLRVSHEVVGDALELHALPENRGAMFQVASQLNCLEFVGPNVVPEDGVSGYAHDPTQGPACALAAAAATVYRNYFAPVAGESGQTRARQIDNLDQLAATVGQFWNVRNGYTSSDAGRLASLREALVSHHRDDVLGAVKIGVQTDVGVTFAGRFVEPDTPKHVSQAFCSAVSCAYTSVPLRDWEPLATLVLDAAYEATLLAAALDAAEGRGSGVVWLTFLGGGAFGNKPEWIAAAIARALRVWPQLDVRVRVAHYRRLDHAIIDRIEAQRG